MVSDLIFKYLGLMDSVKCILAHLLPLKHTSHYSYQLATHVAALGEPLATSSRCQPLFIPINCLFCCSVGGAIGSVIVSGVE